MKVVVLAGPESSGKSWLATQLHARFGGLMVGEYVRYFIDHHQRDTTLADIPAIARGQLAWEDAARAAQPHLLILDTNLLTNKLWSQTLFGDYPAWLDDELLARHYDLHLLLSPEDVEWSADGQRCQPELADRRVFFQGSLDWIEQHQQPALVIRGDWEARRATALEAVEQLLAQPRQGQCLTPQ
ncbi:AAA family ATPase [Pseudomonas sp. 58 R 3]|uniref:AAA family ATPase n=1 Tax=Pseudomonas sp. 58 R 3 TaxID=1844108 RepID=UPI000812997F|nr:AAA family ATPase [Pseudomonas sp. 58 R 3]CRM14358.1 Trifunctional NAD biosynthesis/regulator protein NadR [Pseudomonas sp. 58 R 3]CRM76909.1 Trifunctional NAD biosynthesis/regulator protein NadR [Pseudomonas sp. 58 R 3]CRM82569.1 Trifunctional NAD biosynthesis/regulator protein NadR [Pseudomonas sp. 58 R 3]